MSSRDINDKGEKLYKRGEIYNLTNLEEGKILRRFKNDSRIEFNGEVSDSGVSQKKLEASFIILDISR